MRRLPEERDLYRQPDAGRAGRTARTVYHSGDLRVRSDRKMYRGI